MLPINSSEGEEMAVPLSPLFTYTIELLPQFLIRSICIRRTDLFLE